MKKSSSCYTEQSLSASQMAAGTKEKDSASASAKRERRRRKSGEQQQQQQERIQSATPGTPGGNDLDRDADGIDAIAAVNGPALPNTWSEFKSYIMSIKNDSASFAVKVISRPASAEHERTMDAIRRSQAARSRRYLSTPSSSRNGSRYASRQSSATGARQRKSPIEGREAAISELVGEERDYYGSDDDDDGDADDSSCSDVQVGVVGSEGAGPGDDRKKFNRGWTVLRHAVDDIARSMRKRKQSGWQLLQKTMTYMSDKDGVREQIYDRYLKNPNWWREGFTLPFDPTVNKKIQEIERAQQRARPSPGSRYATLTRPSTARVPSARSKMLDAALKSSLLEESRPKSSRQRPLRPHSAFV